VLLGAGASYGAWDDQSATPPLGGALFDALVSGYPETWGRLNEIQKAAFTGEETRPGFENGMNELWEQELALTHPHPDYVSVQDLLTDMAIYFAAFRLPSEAPNCYSELVRAIAQSGLVGPRLGIATLNYECLLERASFAFGVPVDVGPCDPHQGALTVWKPHGACNLIADAVVNGNIRQVKMTTNMYYATGPGTRLVAVPPERVAEIYRDQDNIPPAMSLYAPSKHSPTAPEMINASRERWTRWARSADVVITVGVRFLPDDHHIWDGIISGRSSVWFVGNATAPARVRPP
jgi:hypothetical protein